MPDKPSDAEKWAFLLEEWFPNLLDYIGAVQQAARVTAIVELSNITGDVEDPEYWEHEQAEWEDRLRDQEAELFDQLKTLQE